MSLPNISTLRGYRITHAATAFPVVVASFFLVEMPAADTAGDEVVELEPLVVRDRGQPGYEDLAPGRREASVLYGEGFTVADVPRSVAVLTSEEMARFGVRDFRDLDRLAAGTQSVNYFGVPGLPFIRGENAAVFHNGLYRAHNRNQIPALLDHVEAVEVVKGAAPAHFPATQAGGLVNLRPKRPDLRAAFAEVEVTAGSYDLYKIALDAGAPFRAGERAAAWRVSSSLQDADSFYRNVEERYGSVYGAVEIEMGPRTSLFQGLEYYDYEGRENAGWNRVTQELIDSGRYVTGLPAFAGGGTGPIDPGAVPAWFPAFSPTPPPGLELVAPGEARLGADDVLVDRDDRSDGRDLLYFLELDHRPDSDRRVANHFLAEHLTTEKRSAYGYAFDTDQTVVENRLLASGPVELPWGLEQRLTVGGSARFVHAKARQDFDPEPFAATDLSTGAITQVRAGPGFWDAAGSGDSDLWQFGVFGQLDSRWTERWSTLFSLRGEAASFDVEEPSGATGFGAREGSGQKNYWSAAFSPVFAVTDAINLYATVQQGVAYVPGFGGTVTGEENFAETEFYEAGIKAESPDGRLFAALAVYYYDKSSFDERSSINNELRGQGAELEVSWSPAGGPEGLRLSWSSGYQRSWLRSDPPFRLLAYTAAGQPQLGGNVSGSGDPFGLLAANNPDKEIGGVPDFVSSLQGSYTLQNGLGFSLGAVYRSSYHPDLEQTLEIPSSVVVNGGVSYESGDWSIALQIDNLTGEDSFYGSDPLFSGAALVTKAPDEPNGRLTVKRRF